MNKDGFPLCLAWDVQGLKLLKNVVVIVQQLPIYSLFICPCLGTFKYSNIELLI